MSSSDPRLESAAGDAVIHASTIMDRPPSSRTGYMWRVGPALVLLLVLLLVLAVFVPAFFKTQNLANVARQASAVGVVSVGMTFVIITAGIDLSVGAILAGTSVLAATLVVQGIAISLVLLLSLAAGALLGALNAFVITQLKIQPFIATLAMAAVIGGIALEATDGTQVRLGLVDDPISDFLGSGTVAGVPGPAIVFLLVALLGALVLGYTSFGRFVYAVGGSQEAARLSGIKVKPVLYGVYCISGLAAAVAGVMFTSRLFVGDPTAGSLIALDAIAAVVIGGTSLFGGSGKIAGTVFGALLLAVLANVLTLVGVSSFIQQVVKGGVIILAVLAASFLSRRRR